MFKPAGKLAIVVSLAQSLVLCAAASSLVASCATGKRSERPEDGEANTGPKEAAAAKSETQAASSPARVEEKTFLAPSLGVEKRYHVYLPAGYDSSEARYPVIYMLHGLGGAEGDWLGLDLVESANEIELQALVVLADGDDSFYANHAEPQPFKACMSSKRRFGPVGDMKTYCVKKADYETYVTQDLIGEIDSNYRTLATQEARGIGGLSMGGYGALTLAMRNKDVFHSVASHSGIDSLLYIGPVPFESGKAEQAETLDALMGRLGPMGPHLKMIFGDDIENWKQHDPVSLVSSIDKGDLVFYLDCGTSDDYQLQNGAAHLAEQLEAKGVDHVLHLVPGRHNAQFWSAQLAQSLRFHADHLADSE